MKLLTVLSLSLLGIFSLQAATFVVRTTADSGPDSLRQAILDANVTLPPNEIHFDIPPGGVQVIFLTSPLPMITKPLLIDGRTQPGFISKPIIRLDGNSAGPGNGLWLRTSDCVVRGLAITSFGVGGPDLRSTGNGIFVDGGGRHVFEGNYIGLDTAGLGAGNGGDGLCLIDSHDNLIGGTNELSRNVISDNGSTSTTLSQRSGIYIYGDAASNNIIQGNFIGTYPSGSTVLGNHGSGVDIAADLNLVGGTEPGAGNVISGNMGIYGGIHLFQRNCMPCIPASRNQVQGNLIGTDRNGLVARGNVASGIYLELADDNRIGGSTPPERNVISGNGIDGISLYPFYFPSSNNVISGNFIGVDASGFLPLPNLRDGIYMGVIGDVVARNLIGGTNNPGQANVISANLRNGVTIYSSRGFAILGNSIFDNALDGIDLGEDGVTENDPCDVDFGANARQNFPDLETGYTDGRHIAISGALKGERNRQYLLQFFWSEHCDGSNHGEGRNFIGQVVVTTDSSCHVSFATTLTASVPIFTSLTGTATALSEYNTSEFSFCRPIVPPLPLVITRSAGNVVVVWPAYLVGWVLQSSPNVLPQVWTDDPTAVVVMGSENTVTEPITPGGTLYRLRSP